MNVSDERSQQKQRLKQAKAEFEALLRKLLPECARGRSGLFGQHARALGNAAAARYYAWPEADKLVALSDEIGILEEKLGDTRGLPLRDAYLGYRAERGADMPGEPRMALRFLQELKREEFVARGLPVNIERYVESSEDEEMNDSQANEDE